MPGKKMVYTHLNGKSEYYPFGARTGLRRRQRHRARLFQLAGVLILLAAVALVVRQSLFRGGQPVLGQTPAEAESHGPVSVNVNEASILPAYRALYAQNHDMIGWLRIDGTEVDYPVMQTPNENEYYLHRGFDKLYAPSGSLFLDAHCRVSGSPTANWLVYGHNMDDGSMFAGLLQYADKDFWQTHQKLEFDTLYRTGEWQVVAVLETSVGADELPYYTFFDAANQQEWQNRVSAMLSRALYDTGCTPQYGDQLLTLSTCGDSSLLTDKRLAVVARRMED